ncbi:hypothetical protein F3Y22_tig00110160pilonHSYRG00308 [Hibiscus syriacus]|uniref:Uncharacterized protein n=1 Tax=Hibiscus syriacus TaxID=106335 RepID=A0A6A3BJZ0_HIBSY|nr:hypothetical protein F3Y22_tig00110160pilonHSYRG00308 [Hibiscus syriacus]
MATKFDIEKFNGRNFSLWKLKMKAIMRKDGCLAAISERPMDFIDDNKWNEMDGNDMANFYLALEDEVLSSIEEKKTAKEIWDHLTKLYEATSLHNKIFLKRKLYTLRISESTSVTEHLNTLNTLFSQLTSLRCTIEEQERAELLLQSLLDSYDQLIINLTNKALTTMRGRSTERGQSSSHKHGRSKSRSKKNLKCYNCGKKGHLKKDCWSLNKNSNPQDNTANTSDDRDALCCETSTTVEGRKRYADIWLIDSGATYHMTSRREWFHHYEPVSGGSVYSYNDHALEIVGVGTIKLKMFRGALVVLKGEKIVANLYMLKGETLLEVEAFVASCSSDSAMLWYLKLGHMSEQGMKILVEKKLLPGLTKVSLHLCEHCITSKKHRLKFNTSNSRGKCVLELVHSNVWQAPVTSLGGAKYFVSFIDDYSRRYWVYPIKNKSDVFSTFKIFKARVELDYGNKIKCFRTDNGGEYTIEEFDDFCRKEGIKRQFTVANTPQQNGVAERINRTLLERTKAIIVYVMYNSKKISKLDPKSRKCKFLGYIDGVQGYRLWDPTAHKVIIIRDVIFVEDKLQRKEDDDSAEKSETTQIHMENEVEQGDSSEAEPTHDEQEPESSEAPTTRQSDRVRRRPNCHSDYVIEGNIAYYLLTENGEPSTYQVAINNSDVSLKPIGSKWVFKIKRNGDDQVERYRARLVVKGYAQKEGIDFDEIFSPVVRLTTVRVVLAMCATLNLHLEQLDVKKAFLYGNLEEEIYMLHPEDLMQTLVFISRGLVITILLLYVDDKLVAEPNKDHIDELKAQLAREFELKDLGSENKILGMQIHRDRSNRKIWLSQKNYLKKIFSRFSMQDCKPISIPLPINFKLSSSMSPSSEEEMMEMSRVPYASVVGSLMFAMICTRPDIAQAVGVSVVATSTTEAEYVAATQASKEAIWLKMLLEELGHNQEYVSLFCDSQSALHLARNPAFHSRTKHIRVQYHFIQEKVEEGTVDMQKIHTKDNIANFMTKEINADKFTWCRSSCGLSDTLDESLSLKNFGLSDVCLATLAYQEEEKDPNHVQAQVKGPVLQVSKDAYESLPSYMTNLSSWEDLLAAVERINSSLSKKEKTKGYNCFHQDEIEALDLDSGVASNMVFCST